MPNGYLIKLEEQVDGEYEIVTFVGDHSLLPEPKETTLFYHIVRSIPELEEDRARQILNIERTENDYKINHEERTVSYHGGLIHWIPKPLHSLITMKKLG